MRVYLPGCRRRPRDRGCPTRTPCATGAFVDTLKERVLCSGTSKLPA